MDTRLGYVYKITNSINDKVYIGKTISNPIDKRFWEHCNNAKKKTKTKLSYAINKYGVDNFKIEPIIQSTNDKLFDLEKEYIEKYDSMNNGYNMTLGGIGVEGRRYKHKKETINKLRKIVKSEEWCNNISKSKMGHTVSEETRIKISNSKLGTVPHNKGVSMSDEMKKRISITKKGSIPVNRKKVQQYTKEGSFIKEFNSVKEAINETNCKKVSAVCNGHRKTSGGYLWKFV